MTKKGRHFWCRLHGTYMLVCSSVQQAVHNGETVVVGVCSSSKQGCASIDGSDSRISAFLEKKLYGKEVATIDSYKKGSVASLVALIDVCTCFQQQLQTALVSCSIHWLSGANLGSPAVLQHTLDVTITPNNLVPCSICWPSDECIGRTA